MATQAKVFSFDHKIELELSDEVQFPLMVCSHERSGTHFLMNSIGNCTRYNSRKFLNFDYSDLGTTINFFSKDNIRGFLEALSKVKNGEKEFCVSNIVKSHFPLPLLGSPLPIKLKIAYIYRDPVDTFISYWRYLNSLKYFEGPKAITPLKLALSAPCGQSQRYQVMSTPTYFDRWALHVSSAFSISKIQRNIVMINYSKLLNDYCATVEYICNCLGIEIQSKPKWSYQDTVIVGGKDMKLSEQNYLDLFEFCQSNIKRFNTLPKDILGPKDNLLL